MFIESIIANHIEEFPQGPLRNPNQTESTFYQMIHCSIRIHSYITSQRFSHYTKTLTDITRGRIDWLLMSTHVLSRLTSAARYRPSQMGRAWRTGRSWYPAADRPVDMPDSPHSPQTRSSYPSAPTAHLTFILQTAGNVIWCELPVVRQHLGELPPLRQHLHTRGTPGGVIVDEP